MTIKITGTGSALPERILTNADLEKMVDTSDEWISERTGIKQRRISNGDTVASLAAKACENALKSAGKAADEVELILVATCSPELLLPCCACQVQSIIGAENAVAFDINAACAGFLFALETARAYISSGMYKNALVVGSEVLSKLVDWSDRSTCVLFGDGAGAVYVEKCDDGSGIISMVQGSDGSKGMVLYCGERLSEASKDYQDTFVHMDGREVYKFATKQVPACIEEALLKANIAVEDIDLFLLHQANKRIIESIAKHLKTDISKFPINLDHVGNMSSAAIPVLLDELNKSGIINKGQKLVLSGFGAGLTYGACVMIW
jgi:3-oxoacyl-[acyl-carrier-protein] synthase-3